MNQAYQNMKANFYNRCWACRASGAGLGRPRWWNAHWQIDRAHITNKPRREDRRAVVLLCPLCHASLDQRVSYPDDSRPRLTTNNAIWLKSIIDPEFYDLDFLKANSVRQDLEPEIPHEFYMSRQPESVKHAGGEE